jgi:hypothetical protein
MTPGVVFLATEEYMPKVYPTGTQKPGTEQSDTGREPGVRKTFGIYDKPVRTSPAMMIGIVVIAALILLAVVLLMMHR